MIKSRSIDSPNSKLSDLLTRLVSHLDIIYPERPNNLVLAKQMASIMGVEDGGHATISHTNHWDQSDIFLITYADSIQHDNQYPLATLSEFMQTHVKNTISSIHLLPFYPYSSDDGFSVIDYYQVNQAMGDWHHIEQLATQYNIMADVVINHCSARSGWFENFKQGKEPGKNFFFEASPEQDTSMVVRPRTHELLKEVDTLDGKKYVWCTFSHDQVDFDFRNPEVLKEFVSIIRFYLNKGINVFRFDAIAFLWKEANSPCINLVQTHEIVKLLRLLVEKKHPSAIIITETNIPNRQNLMYFGNANEAHAIYNFSLPPLLIQTLVTGNCKHLKTWLMTQPPAQNGTTYFNFIASHDGIGLRPVEGILSDDETDEMINTMLNFGGKVSWRAVKGGKNQAYEINISLYDALSGTTKGLDNLQFQRFICAHAIMLAIEGIPAFYIHSLLATPNDFERVVNTGQNRSINRHKWAYDALITELENSHSHHHLVFKELSRLINIRKQQSALHPNATQYTLHLGTAIFAFWRQSPDRKQSLFAINNVSDEPQTLNLNELNLISLDQWVDLISETLYTNLDEQITLAPYQTLWLSNKPSDKS
ncbi:sugar phosphorylase [Thalassotalea aquiviva]|uniref:sugar phosphorylase n=1 Tax=Thalassotalea aquiviva TaxID=3242415 RepID=UPI00352B6E94